MIKAVIFDYGGVFSVGNNLREFCEQYVTENNLKVDIDKFQDLMISLWLKARVGEMDSEILWKELADFVDVDVEHLKQFGRNPLDFRDELLEYILNNLKGQYKLGMISNHIKSWLEPLLEKRGLRDVFDVIMTSYDCGFAKPDTRIYEQTTRELGIEPENCIFIDDVENNLIPARELGMKTIKFENFNQFHQDIERLLR